MIDSFDKEICDDIDATMNIVMPFTEADVRKAAEKRARMLWKHVQAAEDGIRFDDLSNERREWWISMATEDPRPTTALPVTVVVPPDMWTEFSLAENRWLWEREKKDGHRRQIQVVDVWWFTTHTTRETVITSLCMTNCPACHRSAVAAEEDYDRTYGDTADGEAAMLASQEEWYRALEAQIASLNKRVSLLEALTAPSIVQAPPPKRRKKTAKRRR